MLVELRAEKGAELDGVYTRIIDEATAQLLDHLENGDPFIVGGEVKRKPVTARHLALVAAIMFDKRTLARSQLGADAERRHTFEDIAEWCRAKAIAKREGAGEDSRPNKSSQSLSGCARIPKRAERQPLSGRVRPGGG